MNKFDEKYIFRMATMADVDGIMAFIKKYWNKNHILANDKEFFLYEFEVENRINFNLVINKETKEIEVIQGFFQYSEQFVKGITDASGALMKVRPGCPTPYIGIETLKRFVDDTAPRTYIGVGADPVTILPLQKRVLKHFTGRLKQFYMLNPNVEYKIASIKNKIEAPINEEEAEFIECHTAEEMYAQYDEEKYRHNKPYKDKWYMTKRYFNHPIYKYRKFVVNKELVVIAREVRVNDSKVLRIVDMQGKYDEFKYVGKKLMQLIQREGYEYIDIYEKGISDEVLNEAGFVERKEKDENIIPNYFEPFLQENIEVYYHLKDDEVCIFKADGDQDRPNFR